MGQARVKQFPSAASAAITAQCRSGLWQSSSGGRIHQACCFATVLVGAVTLRATDLKESTLESFSAVGFNSSQKQSRIVPLRYALSWLVHWCAGMPFLQMRFWERSLWQLRALSQNLGCKGLGTGVASGHLDVEMLPKLPCGRVFLDAQVKVSEAWLSTEACFLDSVPNHRTGGSPWMICMVHMAKSSLKV